MPLSFVDGTLLAKPDFSSLSFVIVPVEGDLEKELARGPRCVFLSSVVKHCQHSSKYQSPYEDGAVCDLTINLQPPDRSS